MLFCHRVYGNRLHPYKPVEDYIGGEALRLPAEVVHRLGAADPQPADLLWLLVVEHGYRVTVCNADQLAGPGPGATREENCGGQG